jgi:hypothetical protein
MSAFGLEYYKTRKRRKAVASTLLAEVQRIYLEIFGVDKELEDVRLGSHEIPTAIHPWVERIVLDSADIEPSLVRGFLGSLEQ